MAQQLKPEHWSLGPGTLVTLGGCGAEQSQDGCLCLSTVVIQTPTEYTTTCPVLLMHGLTEYSLPPTAQTLLAAQFSNAVEED